MNVVFEKEKNRSFVLLLSFIFSKLHEMASPNDPLLISTPPPQACLNPLNVLNQYLASLESSDTASSSHQQTKHQDEILKTVDFLYGSSALDGALQILEGDSVTCLQSPRRTIYTVQGSRSGQRGVGDSKSSGSCYLCLVPDTTDGEPTTNSGGDSTATDPIYYCSCRSFLEKSRGSGGNSNICKHLLALKLMPALGVGPTIVHLPSEEEFSRALLQRVAPPQSS